MLLARIEPGLRTSRKAARATLHNPVDGCILDDVELNQRNVGI